MNIAITSIKKGDISSLYHIWQAALGYIWTIDEKDFMSIVMQGMFDDVEENVDHRDCLIALDGKEVIGFIIVHRKESIASIPLIVVLPKYQRKSIGTKLLQSMLLDLQKKNITEVYTGSMVGGYFWPGVPRNIPGASHFFSKNGFAFYEKNIDMIMQLQEYITPAFIYERTSKDLLSFATKEDKDQILLFEETYFPDWQIYYEQALHQDQFSSIILCKNEIGEIQGTIKLLLPSQTYHNPWEILIGGKTGGFGCLGVMEQARHKGVGLALAANATEILKESDCDVSFVGWTYLSEWYGKLGYKVWREYDMGKKVIETD